MCAIFIHCGCGSCLMCKTYGYYHSSRLVSGFHGNMMQCTHIHTHIQEMCCITCLRFLSLVDGHQGSPGGSAGTCSHVFCNHPPLWCNTATHLHLHLTAHPLSPAEEQDTRYVRAYACVEWSATPGEWLRAFSVCMYVHTYVHTHMCNDICIYTAILVEWIYVHNELQYTVVHTCMCMHFVYVYYCILMCMLMIYVRTCYTGCIHTVLLYTKPCYVCMYVHMYSTYITGWVWMW